MLESRRAFLSRKYDELFERASEVVKKHNPCKLTRGVCAHGIHVKDGLCCGGCKYLGPKGCTTKSLACKIWLCYFGAASCPSRRVAIAYWKDMAPVETEARELCLDSPRASKEESLRAVLKTGRRALFPPKVRQIEDYDPVV